EEVNMTVRHTFSAVRSVVDDNAVAFSEPELPGEVACCQEEGRKNFLILVSALGDARKEVARHDQHMSWCLRIKVVEGDALFVIVHDPGGDFARHDTLKDGWFSHG